VKFNKKSKLADIRLYSTPSFTLNSTISKCTGATKRYTQSYCEYSLPKLRESILQAFDSISVERVRSFARLSFRWMDAYRHGLKGKVAQYVVKKYKKHRSINEEIINQVNELLS